MKKVAYASGIFLNKKETVDYIGKIFKKNVEKIETKRYICSRNRAKQNSRYSEIPN